MRLSAAVLAATLVATAVEAREVVFPLVVDHALLRASLARQLGEEADGSALVWGTRGGCRSLILRDLRVGPAAGRVRVSAQATAHLGFRFLGFCFAPLSWKGNVESVARPALGDGWQLRLRDLDSRLYDAAWQRTMVASRLWDVVKGRLESELTAFAFDLAPPVEEAQSLIRASVEPARARPVLEALATLHPLGVEVDDEGVKVHVALDLPPADTTPSPPEPPLAPMEMARWQQLLESWDGFLVFVVKDLGAADADPGLRDALLDLLLASRHRLLDALAGGPEGGVDPVRQLFLDAWEGLRGVVRQSLAHGGPQDRLLRYASFVAPGHALPALDAPAPSLGLEISSDGLRRLARVLDPTYLGDPLAYTEAPDPVLRELFHFHEPAPSESTPAPPPADESSWLGPRAAWAAPPPDELGTLAHRLDRWLPRADEPPAYPAAVARLRALAAGRTAGANAVEARLEHLYGVLVPAVAWQESCWRQFVERDGQVTYLLSKSGDVGIMQVNRRVWRGFFDLEKLEWDIAYNAGAGAEILAQMLNRYGVREGRAQVENAARATYSAYNGGPDAYRRYRLARVAHAQRAIDVAFWKKYRAMAAGRALDFVLCIQGWPPSRTQLSVAPRAAMPNSCMRSRRSSATRTIEACHISIARRPIASFV